MPKTPPYSKEFRAERSGCCVPVVGRSRCWAREWAARSSRAHWSRQVDVNAGEVEGLTSDQREELRRLRRENLILAEERDILKKAAAFFAKDSETR
jgi:transposase